MVATAPVQDGEVVDSWEVVRRNHRKFEEEHREDETNGALMPRGIIGWVRVLEHCKRRDCACIDVGGAGSEQRMLGVAGAVPISAQHTAEARDEDVPNKV